ALPASPTSTSSPTRAATSPYRPASISRTISISASRPVPTGRAGWRSISTLPRTSRRALPLAPTAIPASVSSTKRTTERGLDLAPTLLKHAVGSPAAQPQHEACQQRALPPHREVGAPLVVVEV